MHCWCIVCKGFSVGQGVVFVFLSFSFYAFLNATLSKLPRLGSLLLRLLGQRHSEVSSLAQLCVAAVSIETARKSLNKLCGETR